MLVVYDDSVNSMVAKLLLQREGPQVLVTEGGLESVESVVQGDLLFEAVFMDVHMPEIDGIEACRRIRHDGRFNDLPNVALTANVSEECRTLCFAAGVNGFLTKPIGINKVVTELNNILSSSL